MLREHICFTCQGACTSNHRCKVKGDREASETAKIEAMHKQSYKDDDSSPDMHPCLVDKHDEHQSVPMSGEDQGGDIQGDELLVMI